MKSRDLSRRKFIENFAITAALGGGFSEFSLSQAKAARETGEFHLATNSYPWQVFYSRDGKNYGASLDKALGEIAASGLDGYEPGGLDIEHGDE